MSETNEPEQHSDLVNDSSLKTHMIINLNSNMLVMSQMVGEMATAVKEVAIRITDVEARRRRDRIVFGSCMVIVGLVSVVGFNLVSTSGEELRILKSATSPERRAVQAEDTQRVVRQIDCNNKANTRNVLIAIQGAIPDVSIPPDDVSCSEFREGQ